MNGQKLPLRRALYVTLVIAAGAATVVAVRSAHVSRSRHVLLSAAGRVPDLGLEGQPPDSPRQRIDPVGLVRRQSRWPCCCSGRAPRSWWRRPARLDAVHGQRQAALSAAIAPCSASRPRSSPWRRRAWRIRPLAARRVPSTFASLDQAAGRRHRDVLLPEHGPGRRRNRIVDRSIRRGACGARTSCGARRASWWPAPPARIAAVVIHRGEQWKAVLLLAPIYLTYRTYRLFVGRLEDQKRHHERGSRPRCGKRRRRAPAPKRRTS